MGVDMVIGVRGTFTPEQEAKLRWRVARVFGSAEAKDLSKYEEEDRVEFYNGWRYYDTGYARGPWPQIRALLLLFRQEFPECVIHYAPDSIHSIGPEATDALIAEIDAYWVKNDNQRYDGVSFPTSAVEAHQ